MQSQLTCPSASDQEPEPQVEIHHTGDEEHQHEKTSTKMLKKVKEKAKKIKSTLTKHGHEREHGHGENIPDDHDLDEEDDDEDEEMVVDPEVHGAPMYESTALRSQRRTTGQPESLSHPGKVDIPATELEVPPGAKVFPVIASGHAGPADPIKSSALEESKSAPQNTPVSLYHGTQKTRETGSDDRSRTFVPGQPKVNLGRPRGLEEDPAAPKGGSADPTGKGELHAPQNAPISSFHQMPQTRETGLDDAAKTFVPGREELPGQPKVNLDRPRGLEEDPAAPKEGAGGASGAVSNYQTKVADPTGKVGREAGISPMIHSLGKMKLTDKPTIQPGSEQEKPKSRNEVFSHFPTGSHDQFSPEPTPPKPITSSLESPSSDTEAFALKKTENEPSYREKITTVTAVIADKAAAAKDTIASKLGYTGGGHEGEESRNTGSAVEYGKKVASTVTDKLTPVYEKVKETSGTVVSKLPLSGASTGASCEVHKGQDKGVSVRDYIAEKLRPGDEDKALSEVIAETLQRKRKEEEKGEVTESNEVTKRLGGSGDEKSEAEEKHGASFADNSQMGMVEKLKGAVTSWLGKSKEQTPGSGQSHGYTKGLEGFSGSAGEGQGQTGGEAGERRLQESGN